MPDDPQQGDLIATSKIESLSAHADYSEILDWLRKSDVHATKV